jgi:hypothetical protein
MIRAPFDPIAALAAEFHDEAHRDEPCASNPAACPSSVALATDLRARLAARGLVVAPRTVIEWATRMLDDADRDSVDEAVPSPAATDSERRIREVVWVRLRHPVAPPTRLGPYERWLGELVLGDISLSHGPDVIGAVIEPEGAWIGELMGSLEL